MDISVWLRAEAGLGPRHIWHIPHCVSWGSGWSLSMFQPRHEVSLALAYLRMGASVTNKFPINSRWALVTGTSASVMSSGGSGSACYCDTVCTAGLGHQPALCLVQCSRCWHTERVWSHCAWTGEHWHLMLFCMLVVYGRCLWVPGMHCVCMQIAPRSDIVTSCLHGAGHICDCVTRLCHAVTTFHTNNQGLKGNSQICTQQGYTLYSQWHGEGEGWIPPSA